MSFEDKRTSNFSHSLMMIPCEFKKLKKGYLLFI